MRRKDEHDREQLRNAIGQRLRREILAAQLLKVELDLLGCGSLCGRPSQIGTPADPGVDPAAVSLPVCLYAFGPPIRASHRLAFEIVAGDSFGPESLI